MFIYNDSLTKSYLQLLQEKEFDKQTFLLLSSFSVDPYIANVNKREADQFNVDPTKIHILYWTDQ